jgi:hypothetical protein
MSRNRRTTNVEPVLIVGCQFLGLGCLHEVNPFWNFGLPRSAINRNGFVGGFVPFVRLHGCSEASYLLL